MIPGVHVSSRSLLMVDTKLMSHYSIIKRDLARIPVPIIVMKLKKNGKSPMRLKKLLLMFGAGV